MNRAQAAPHGLELVVFDLDDTLYPEWEYVRSGFRHLAQMASEAAGVPAQLIFNVLWAAAQQPTQRGNTIDRLLEHFPSISRAWGVGELVGAYRRHSPEIALYPGVRGLLEELQQVGMRLGVITDGAPDSQRRKLEALRLSEILAAAVVTDEFGIECRKPSCFAFLRIARHCRVEPHSCLYIGDNPAKDFAGARRLGWQTVRLRMAGQLHEQAEAPSPEFAPHCEVTGIGDLRGYLRGCAGTPATPAVS